RRAAAGISERCEMRVWRTAKRIRRKHHDEIDAQGFPVDSTHIGDRRGNIAAKHIDDDCVAKLETQAVGDPFFERNQWWPIVIRPPPLSLDQPRPGGNLVAVSEAAVALQDPSRVFSWLDALDRGSAGRDDATAQHWYFFQLRCGRLRVHESIETLNLIGGDVEEIKRRGFRRQFV